MNSQELEDRLIEFAVAIIKIIKLLPNTIEGKTIANQLIRSETSPALNYGEARGAESNKDYIHKLQIVLKELRETFICLKIIKMATIVTNYDFINTVLTENNELICIFVSTLKSLKSKKNN